MSVKKVVVIGGGTGTFTVLTGLKEYDLDLTAVVSMADSGGSTGRLRDEFGVLPPGDVRRALVALSSSPEQLILRQLFDYRFSKGSGLNGHSFGNLFLTALSKVVGSDVAAITEAGRILNIKGMVLPVTLKDTTLVARLIDGTFIRGETNIDRRKIKPELNIQDVFLDPPARVYKEVVTEILLADLIVLGPGDLYTSVIANLLVGGLPSVIRKSKARVVYICNIMSKFSETNGYTASDYLGEVNKYLGVSRVDEIIINQSKYPQRLLKKYSLEKAYPVMIDMENLKKMGVKITCGDYVRKETLVRHDFHRLARAILSV